MAYVTVPKDLSKIKTKVAFNLTKRQIVCLGCGIAAFLFAQRQRGDDPCGYGNDCRYAALFPLCHV